MRTLNSSAADRDTPGFTLVEMLVIAPVMILIIAAFITFIVGVVGEMLVTSEYNRLTLETSTALAQAQQDVHWSVQLLDSTGPVPSPQGRDSTATPFNASVTDQGANNTLVTSQFATNKKYEDLSRELILYANTPTYGLACTSPSIKNNKAFQHQVVYFLQQNAGTSPTTYTLWRRTIIPPYIVPANLAQPSTALNAVCQTPYQLNTCALDKTASICAAKDMKLMTKVSKFRAYYYLTPDDITPITNPSLIPSARAVTLLLESISSVAGREIKHVTSLRIDIMTASW